MAERYDPSVIEPKWQAFWERDKTFRTPEETLGNDAYVLDMFPYPSGAGLHVGHPEGYTATDIVARFLRARGHGVLHPMGWDAFGLPAEQHAIRTGTHPSTTTAQNVETFKRQLKALGFSYDWDREIDTTDPAYVRWTQWIFLRMFHRELAYQAEVPVNWCPALGTVLANEEVKEGKSEIGGHPVVRAPLRQWMLRITAYADRLLDDLVALDWPESTRTMQREWIGRSEGAEVSFPIVGRAVSDAAIQIFTTRPDTLFGATFMVLAPEHALVETLTSDAERSSVEAYVERTKRRSELDRKAGREKTGVFTGGYAINPVNQAHVPVWIADYVLPEYGTGAIMAVPAHDERDFEFASVHGLPIVEVISPDGVLHERLPAPFVGEGAAVRSGRYDGLRSIEFKQRIIADLERDGIGRRRVEYKLHDWIFSRQRYWGEPIPVYFPVETNGDPRNGAGHRIRYDQPIAVEESELPVLLPALEDFRPGEDPAGPLARAAEWRFFERNGQWYARETNTMPQWAGSCWYYLRFLDPHNTQEPWSKSAADRWLPVDLYVGGAEHSVLHLLYARFWHKVLFDEGLVSTPEPFAKLVHQGMILGEVEYTEYVASDGTPIGRDDVEERDGGAFAQRSTGRELTRRRVNENDTTKNRAGEVVLKSYPDIVLEARAHKMSKSRGNVVSPDEVIERFGADAMRMYEMFLGPLEATKPWNTNGIQGVRRFLDRTWELCHRADSNAEPDEALLRMTHRTIRKVTDDITHLHFNTAVSTLMMLSNELTKRERVPKSTATILVLLVHPFAPHVAEELWEQLGYEPSIQKAPWPGYDPALCEEDEVEIAIQINGKVRGRARLPKGASENDAMTAARADEHVARHLENATIRKVIWVPNKILNVIVG